MKGWDDAIKHNRDRSYKFDKACDNIESLPEFDRALINRGDSIK